MARAADTAYDPGLDPLPPPGLARRLASNLARLRERIDAARRTSPRAAATVKLLVVTKSIPPSWFPSLADAGVREVAENRVQAAESRRAAAPAAWTWHLVGHLQRNKARRARELFDVFHALDSLELARRIASIGGGAPTPWPVYIQVNAADDPQKGGVVADEVPALVKALAPLTSLTPIGFMTMARLGATATETRRAFGTLREVRDEACRRGDLPRPPAELSMGMSDDFELAVEEGATVVRLGTAVFEGCAADPERGA
jgi:PLP dependent protein